MVDYQTIIKELNLDDTDDNKVIINNLLSQGKSIILGALPDKVNEDTVTSDPLYERALVTIVTQFYYDRTLERGLSLGMRMLLMQLVGKYSNE